jgi:glycosyltransferase involved in cell wall biosynthesis
MKIAHVITRLIVGGAQENTILTCEGLVQQGHDVSLVAGPETGPEGSLWPRAQQRCGQTVCVESLRRNINPWHDSRAARQLTRVFREGRFDLVHTHSSKAGILGRYAARRAGVPLIIHTIHGMSFNRTQGGTTHWLYRKLERRAARYTDAIVCVADAMATQAVAAGLAPADQFVTIRSGVETDLYGPRPKDRAEVRAEWGFRPDAIVVGTVARLFRNKGYEHLLEAMPQIVADCPKVRFVWVGDGAHHEDYVAKLRRMRLIDHVHLTGLVQPSEIPRIMNGLDVLAHASMWEGLPRALVQAALTAVPAVSFDNDGAPEAIKDGVTGWLVPLGDTEQLASRVAELCVDRPTRLEMGRAAREHCLERFDHRLMVDQIDELYRRLAATTQATS